MTGFAIMLLVILLLVIGLILVILFSPISYQIDVVSRHPYKGEFIFRWMGRIFSIHLVYEEGKPFFKEVYILCKKRFSSVSNYDEWLAKRVEKEFDQEKNVDLGKEPQTYNEALKMAPQGPLVEKVTFTEDGEVNEIICQSTDDKENGLENKKIIFTSFDDLKASLKNKVDTAKEEVESVLHSDSQVPFDWWIPYVKDPDLYKALWKITKQTYNHSKPREFFIEGTFGLGNPYDMGKLSAFLYAMWAEKLMYVNFDYLHYTCQGSMSLKGRILPIVMAWYGTCFILHRPIRKFLWAAIKVFRIKRREGDVKDNTKSKNNEKSKD